MKYLLGFICTIYILFYKFFLPVINSSLAVLQLEDDSAVYALSSATATMNFYNILYDISWVVVLISIVLIIKQWRKNHENKIATNK